MEFQSPFEFPTIDNRIEEAAYEELLENFTFVDEAVLEEFFKDSKFYKAIQEAIKKVEKIFKEELKRFGAENKNVKGGVSTKGQIKPKEVNAKSVEKDKVDGHGVQIASFKNVDDEMIGELKGRVNARIKDYGKITSHKTNNKSVNSSAPNGFIMFVYKQRPLTEDEFDNDLNKEVFNEAVAYNYINEAKVKRSELKDSDFGVPSQKKFPLTDAGHVRSAIKFFNYVDKAHEDELAKNIKKKAKQFGVNLKDIKISDKNRLSNHIKRAAVKEEFEIQYKIGEPNSHIEFESVLFGGSDREPEDSGDPV